MPTHGDLDSIKLEIVANPLFWLILHIPSLEASPPGAIVLIHPIKSTVEDLAQRLETMPTTTTPAIAACDLYRVPLPHPYLRLALRFAGEKEAWAEALAAASAIASALLLDRA